MRYKSLLLYILSFCLGMVTVYGYFRIKRHQERMLAVLAQARFGLPSNDTVRIDSTNLPIILINTDGSLISKEDYITAKMTIIDNGESKPNYADTIAYPDQSFDYNGYIALRFRGNSSFYESDKKPYAIRSIDKPLEEGGVKKKCKLLGMRKGKKWVLLAPYSDRSMIRDALAFELARNYMDFVPQTRFCEVILNGVYMGVHILSEQITADRLKIGKPNHKGNDVTGGYLLEIDTRYKSPTVSMSWSMCEGSSEGRIPDSLILNSPKKEDLTPEQKQYVLSTWNTLDKTMTSGSREEWLKVIDELSFIDFMLSKEFASDVDSYYISTFIYKANDDVDNRFKVCLWDFNIAYGNCNYYDAHRTDVWNYKRVSLNWWAHMMEDDGFRQRAKTRWSQYRRESYSWNNIENVIDSLTIVLTTGGAEARNSKAWKIWPPTGKEWHGAKYIWPNKYISSSYADEIDYLKGWIKQRIVWMDEQLEYRQNVN